MGPKKTPLGLWGPKRPLWGYGPQSDPSEVVGLKMGPSGVMGLKKTPLGLWASKRPLWGFWPQKDLSGTFGLKKTPVGLLAPKRLLWGFWPQKDPFGLLAPKRPLWGCGPNKMGTGGASAPKKDPYGDVGPKKTPLGLLASKPNQTKWADPMQSRHPQAYVLVFIEGLGFCIGKYMCTTMAQSCFYSNSNPTLHVQYS